MGSIVAAFCTFLAKLFADEFKEWLPWITERIVQRAVRSLPENQRERFCEEWHSHLSQVPGELTKLWVAFGFIRAGWKMSKILSGRASHLPEEPESAKPGPLHSLHIVFGTPVPKDDVPTVEGSLDVFWENNLEPTSPPLLRIHFLRYIGFRGGAQQASRIVGFSNLEAYLTKIGLTSEDAKQWVRRLSEHKSVSIPNVMLPEPYLAAYEPQPLAPGRGSTMGPKSG